MNRQKWILVEHAGAANTLTGEKRMDSCNILALVILAWY